MTMFTDTLLDDVRNRFAHVDSCPKAGPRIFFENADGALTLKSAVETSTYYAAIPDNPGRDNEMVHDLVDTINRAKDDMRVFVNAPEGGHLCRQKRHRATVPPDHERHFGR